MLQLSVFSKIMYTSEIVVSQQQGSGFERGVRPEPFCVEFAGKFL